MSFPFRSLIFAGLFATLSTAVAGTQTRPNIVVLLADDMGWADFSCFGNKRAQTPNFDRLAAEGVRFEQFYVNAPICSPSRAAILTGQYPQRWRINSYLDNRAANARRGMADWLDPRAPSLARILRDAGYATGHFGKWHLGGQRDVGDAPAITEYGFEESLTNFEGLGPRLLPLCERFDGTPPARHALGSDKLGRGPIEWVDRAQITSRFTAAAIDFIRRAGAEGKPFYLNLWPDDVHSPWFPPKDRWGDGSPAARYRGVLEAMDAAVGPILDLLRTDPKLRDNTILLVFSDNGPESGGGSAGPFRGFKAGLYEGGIRSPLVVWAPGAMDRAKTGSTNRESVFAAVDLLPSLLAVAGVKPPADLKFDGVALPDVLLGRSSASRGEPLFFRRPPDRKSFNGEKNLPDLAVRDGRWKLLCDYDGSRPQLYDLAVDPGEKTNLAPTHVDRARAMADAAVKWNRSLPPAIDDAASADRNGEARTKVPANGASGQNAG